MSSNTTIVFVPGAWHTPDAFESVAKILRDQGYQTELVALASVGPKEHLKDKQPDVDVIRSAVQKHVDAGQKVVLVAHSYGGIPSTEAAYGLDYATRQKEGQEGGITHIFFLASFIIPGGKTLIEAFGGQDLPWFMISDDKTEVNPQNPAHVFYNDVDEETTQKMVASLKPHSYQVFHSKLINDTWRTIPSTYLYCTLDNAIPLFVQELMVNEFAKGTEIRTDKLEAGHSPFLSKVQETADAIKRAAEL